MWFNAQILLNYQDRYHSLHRVKEPHHGYRASQSVVWLQVVHSHPLHFLPLIIQPLGASVSSSEKLVD